MKNKLATVVLLSLVLGISVVSAQKKQPIATIFKPIGNVTYKTGDKDWAKAKPAIPLLSGDLVRTDENSFAIVKFLENSILRVQEKSEVTISGEITQKKEFSKNVYLERGSLGFQVKHRPNEKFEFSTPTSVASIRGTGGLLIAGSDSNDVLILGTGVVQFRNLLSNFIATVKAGQTAFSFTDGTIKVTQTTPEEQRMLQGGNEDSTGSEGSNNNGGQNDTTTTSATGIRVGLAMSAPPTKENNDMTITVEVTESSLTLDSLKHMAASLTLFYKPKPDQTFKPLSGQLSDRAVKFTIPATDVFAPSIQAYVSLKLTDGSEFTAPATSPESSPETFAVQSGKTNEIRIDFTDPNGKKKTMVIEYK